jgi:hypothetical protein
MPDYTAAGYVYLQIPNGTIPIPGTTVRHVYHACYDGVKSTKGNTGIAIADGEYAVTFIAPGHLHAYRCDVQPGVVTRQQITRLSLFLK